MRSVLFVASVMALAGCSLDWDGIVQDAPDGAVVLDGAADSELPGGEDPCDAPGGDGCPGFTQIAVGGLHSCGLQAAGTVVCWGHNIDGQLGIGNDHIPGVPVAAGTTDVVSVSAGSHHTCALHADQTVSCWGRNWSGQLGIGSTDSSEESPVPLPELGGVISLAAGDEHTCAVATDRMVYCWGHNRDGQVGTEPDADDLVYEPRPVVGVNDPVEVATGGAHSCALLGDGRVMCWGQNDAGELGNGTMDGSFAPVEVMGLSTAQGLALGGEHSCALRRDKKVVCWGHNRQGQLGDGSTTGATIPREVRNLESVAQIAAGPRHTCALDDAGAVWCWGRNRTGELGDGMTSPRLVPQQVPNLPPVTEIRTGGVPSAGHVCARTARGALYCWGHRSYGQLGDGAIVVQKTPVQVEGAEGSTIVAVGDLHACSGGPGLRCWGAHDLGQVGSGSDMAYGTPETPSRPAEASSVAAGESHSCAIDSAGELWCWGHNEDGELGLGDFSDRFMPVKVGSESDWLAVDAGGNATCGIRGAGESGRVWCWGDNSDGQLGDGTASGERATPAEIASGDLFTAVTVGDEHACAIREDGELYCWGRNARGQLGVGDALMRTSPAQTSIGDAMAVDAGAEHTCAIRIDGDVWCWGNNSRGELNNPVSSGSEVPVVTAVGGASALALGERFSCAIVGGDVTCWGQGTYGQLGRARLVDEGGPEKIDGLSGVVSIGAANMQACTVNDLAETWCWGFAGHGRLGDGEPPFTTTAVVGTDLRR